MDEVLIFNETHGNFADSLCKYLIRFPEKRIISIAPQDLNGTTFCNVVVVREKRNLL